MICKRMQRIRNFFSQSQDQTIYNNNCLHRVKKTRDIAKHTFFFKITRTKLLLKGCRKDGWKVMRVTVDIIA